MKYILKLINNLLKLFMDDILSFLENIEEITKEHKKLKNLRIFKESMMYYL